MLQVKVINSTIWSIQKNKQAWLTRIIDFWPQLKIGELCEFFKIGAFVDSLRELYIQKLPTLHFYLFIYLKKKNVVTLQCKRWCF